MMSYIDMDSLAYENRMGYIQYILYCFISSPICGYVIEVSLVVMDDRYIDVSEVM